MIARALVSLASSSSWLVVVGLAACGGRSRGPSEPGAAGSAPAGTDTAGAGGGGAQVVVTAAGLCERIFALKAEGCDLVEHYDLTENECTANYTRSLEQRGPEAREIATNVGRCFLDLQSCDAVATCTQQATGGDDPANNGQPVELRACAQDDVYAPVGLSSADWARRKGATGRFFREAASSLKEPVEVCGIPAQMDWLLDMSCDDGSNPYGGSRERAHASRVGNEGPGGRCGSIIDLYEVTCPEGTYEVHLDAYVCPVPDGQPVP